MRLGLSCVAVLWTCRSCSWSFCTHTLEIDPFCTHLPTPIGINPSSADTSEFELELFDVRLDPFERTNLLRTGWIGRPARRRLLAALQLALQVCFNAIE